MSDVFVYTVEADLEGTEEVTEFKHLAPGLYMVEIGSNIFKATKTGKLMSVVEFNVLEPNEGRGQVHTEWFVLGSDDIPTAFVKDQFGSRRWKTMLSKAGVRGGNNIDQAALQSKGSRLIVSVSCEPDKFTNREGEVKDVLRNRVTGFYSTDERKPQITGTIPTLERKLNANDASPPGEFVSPGVKLDVPAGGIVQGSVSNTVKCPTCDMQVEMKDYAGHVANCGK